MRRRSGVMAALLALVCALPAPARPAPVSGDVARARLREVTSERLQAVTSEKLQNRYAQLVARRRPDLAERWGLKPRAVAFAPLDEATAPAHLRELQQLLAEVAALPASGPTDTLRARLASEIAETEPGGALRRDPLLWLDMVAAAVRAPFALGPAGGCDRTRRAELQLRVVPEALRSAIVLMRDAPPSDPGTLEGRMTQLEQLLRNDLPARTEPCKEGRRRADFVVADSAAAASLAQFRGWLMSGH